MSLPKRRRIAVITSSRSDYAHLRCLLADLHKNPLFDLRVIALGPHLSPEFGHTGMQIQRYQGSETVECLLSSDTDIGMAKTLGLATLGLADVLGRMRPDLLLLIADRYEMLAPAAVALTLRIPVAHIEGGEITSGAIDDAVRNAITKMSHLHFACTQQARRRVIGMGESTKRVIWSGSLSLDSLRRAKLLTKDQLEKKLSISFRDPTILVVYHPVTLLHKTTEEAPALLSALHRVKRQVLFVYPNADAGCRRLIQMAKSYISEHPRSKMFVNLDHTLYLSLMRSANLMAGNSSSGIIEATSLKVPVVNVGIRQRGREHAANVIDVRANANEIVRAIERASSLSFRQSIRKLRNPYGDGHASERIISALEHVQLGGELLFKT